MRIGLPDLDAMGKLFPKPRDPILISEARRAGGHNSLVWGDDHLKLGTGGGSAGEDSSSSLTRGASGLRLVSATRFSLGRGEYSWSERFS